MIVVADSSPLNYLVLIDEIGILPELFRRVVIPEAVVRELQSPQTPPKVATWMAARPTWLDFQAPSAPKADADLDRLGAGEREAIQYAAEHRADALLLIDEGKGRREASRRQIRIIGTLGILALAAERDLLNLPEAIDRLTRTTFHVTPTLLRMLLERHAERKPPQPPKRKN